MCLITEQKEPIQITEDLIVYKVCNITYNVLSIHSSLSDIEIIKNVISQNSRFIYVKNVLNKTEFNVDNIFHTYADLTVATYYDINNNSYLAKLTHIHEGFHFAFEPDRIKRYLHDTNLLCEFKIPKGSLIFKDLSGLGVTNNIIFNKVVAVKHFYGDFIRNYKSQIKQ